MVDNTTKSSSPTPRLRRFWVWAGKYAFLEKPTPTKELRQLMQQGSKPMLAYYMLLALSTFIGTSGLLANSAGVIIGAMIVAPLMNPIMALSFGAGRADWKLSLISLGTVVTGVLVTVLLAFLGTRLLGLSIAGSEILSRAQPTLLDFAIACAAGAAAAFAYSRKSIANTLPGTAVAVALVPPLCVVGIGLGIADKVVPDVGFSYVQLGPESTGKDIAAGAFILFLTNLAGILLAAEVVLILQGYGTLRKGAIGVAATLVVVVVLMLPLGLSLRTLYSRSVAMKIATRMSADTVAQGDIAGTILATRVYYLDDELNIDVKALIPESRSSTIRDRGRAFQQRIENELGESVKMNFQVILVPIEKFTVGDD